MQRQLSAKKSQPQEVAAAIDEAVGKRIRALHKSKALALKTITSKTGLSSPTLRALMTLANAMQVNLADIIRGAAAPVPTAPAITRAADRSSITLWKSGIRKLALAGGGLAAGAPFSLTLLEFAVRASSGPEPYTHQGEQAGYVLQGRGRWSSATVAGFWSRATAFILRVMFRTVLKTRCAERWSPS